MDYGRMSNASHVLSHRLRLAIMLLIVLFGTSCRSKEIVSKTETVYVDRCIVDTIVTVEADTASMRALIECDSLGNVLVNELALAQGQRVSVEPLIRYVPVVDDKGEVRRGAYMSVVALADSLQQHISILEEQIRRQNHEDAMVEKQTGSPIRAFLFGILIGVILTLIGLFLISK